MAKGKKKEEESGDEMIDTFNVGDTVTIGETFASYQGERAIITRIGDDRMNGGALVADLELLDRKQEVDNSPIWFQNVELSHLSPAE
jgi:hypothetical protein